MMSPLKKFIVEVFLLSEPFLGGEGLGFFYALAFLCYNNSIVKIMLDRA